MKMLPLALSALLLLPAAALAAPQAYELEAPHTQVLFSVDHLGFTKSYGQFTGISGGFTFDPEAVETSSVEVTIDTNSLSMEHGKWDAHLKNPDFFNVEKFPTMTFKSTKIEKTGEKTGKLTGDLTLLGVTKPVTLDVTWNKSGPHPMSGTPVAGFSARGTLKRSDFGMNYGVPNVGDEVEMIIEAQGDAKTDDAKAGVTAQGE